MFFPVDMFEKTLSQWQTRYIKLMELIETEYKNRTLPLQTLDCSEVSLSEGIGHKLFWKSTKSQLEKTTSSQFSPQKAFNLKFCFQSLVRKRKQG